jgi:hypothetical protein
VVNNKGQFIVNSATYNINTRKSTNLHLPQTNLAMSQKGVYYLGIKLSNSLPSKIKNFSTNPKNLQQPEEISCVQTPFIH